jgi:hypothetical protein
VLKSPLISQRGAVPPQTPILDRKPTVQFGRVGNTVMKIDLYSHEDHLTAYVEGVAPLELRADAFHNQENAYETVLARLGKEIDRVRLAQLQAIADSLSKAGRKAAAKGTLTAKATVG